MHPVAHGEGRDTVSIECSEPAPTPADVGPSLATLEPTEADFEATLATIGELGLAVSFFDRDYRLRVVNDKYFDLIGLPAEKFPIGTPIAEMFRYNAQRGEYGPGDPETQVAERMELVREMEAHHFRRTRSDGVILEVAGRPLASGGFVTIYRDVTVETRATEELQRQRNTLELTLNALEQGVILVDRDLRLTVANPRFFEILGLDAALFPVGRCTLADFFRHNAERGEYGAGDVEDLVAERVALADKREAHRFERVRPDGTIIDVSGVPTAEGGFLTVFSDITNLRRSQSALENQKRWLDTTLNNMDQGITLFDSDLTLQAINPKFFEIMGFPAERFPLGVHFSDFMRYNAERGEYGPGDVEAQVAERVAIARRFQAHTFTRERSDGTIVEVRGLPVLDEAGSKTVGFITVYSDVTRQKQAERELLAAKESAEASLHELREAQETLVQSEKMAALGRLVAGVAHELNTPIGNGLTLASHLRDQAAAGWRQMMTGKVRKADIETLFTDLDRGFDLIVKSLTSAADLVQSFKSVAVDQSTSVRRRFALHQAIHEVVQTLEPSIRRAGHGVDMAVPDDIQLDSHPGPLQQVLLNLINNALAHAFDRPGGRIAIEVTTGPEAEQVTLTVADDGIGMDAEVRSRAFDPFFTTKLGQGGSGLGLNIVHATITGLLGGRVRLDSAPGRGSRFTIVLPVVAPEIEGGGG